MHGQMTAKQIREFDEQAWRDQQAALKVKKTRQKLMEYLLKSNKYWRVV